MADIDIETTISDVKLFIEKLKSDLPEVFSSKEQSSEGHENSGKVLYMGDLLETKIKSDPAAKNSVVLQDGVLLFTINNPAENLSAMAEEWLKEQAKAILPVKTKEWAQKIGVEFNNIVIKDQKTMWASCSQKHNLNFSYRIIKMPKIIIDYLIIHELSHLIHFNHGEEYWASVAVYSPDYKEHRKWLNNNRYAVMADSDIKYNPSSEVRVNA